METLVKSFANLQLFRNSIKHSMYIIAVPNREVAKTHNPNPKPRKRHPEWLPKPTRVKYNENLTAENKEFLNEYVRDKYENSLNSPLKLDLIGPNEQWTPKSKRTGLIAKKIGVYPMWLKNGKRITTTLLQILDNQVIKYIPPEEYNPVKAPIRAYGGRKLGCLVVGAENADPQFLTKEYCGIFKDSGVIPKKFVSRFVVTPDAVLQPGTSLYAAHFKPGEVVDIRSKTIDRGFQGVIKRWGFKGMPASHGQTKTYRRPGCIGAGNGKARVMPGTKLPGHMGNRYRVHRGFRILRVNTKYNVIWILGQNLPGEIGTFCNIYDTILPLRKLKSSPYFPTYAPEESEDKKLAEDIFVDDLHTFREPSIEYKPDQ